MADEPIEASRGPMTQSGGAAEAPVARLRAGPLEAIYTSGELRYVRWGQREILRRIYLGVRDRVWNTVPARLSDVRITQEEAGFEIAFRAHHADAEVDFVWQGSITGDADGAISYRMAGQAQRGFWRSRIGICVLHPLEGCAGQPCRITHVDGSIEEGAFPDEISPHQPFLDIQAIAHPVGPGVWAEVRFQGETFEMEDQRNWSDGSFKTYSTPLRLPYPVWVDAGATIEQSATLALVGRLPAAPAQGDQGEVRVFVGSEAPKPLPRLGLGMAVGAATSVDSPQGWEPYVIERLAGLRLAHLRADLALDRRGWQADLMRAAVVARSLGVPVEFALTLSADAPAELEGLAALPDALPEVWAWLIFSRGRLVTVPELVQAARPVLQRLAPAALVGGGSDTYFAQLNRMRPPAGLFDVVSYPITPQVHAEDGETLVESLEGQAATVRTARTFAGRALVAVSPVTLKPRGSRGAQTAGAAAAPPPADPRQGTLFGAGWTAISFKYLAESGADSVTYFETTGPRGVMSTALAVFPLYHVLADIGEFARGGVMPCVSSLPLQADALLLAAGLRRRLLMASFADVAQTVVVAGQGISPGSAAAVRSLDETNAGCAEFEPESYRANNGRAVEAAPSADGLRLHLPPHAIVRVDWDAASSSD